MFNWIIPIVGGAILAQHIYSMYAIRRRASNRAKALREVDNPLTWCREMGDAATGALRSAYSLEDLRHTRSLLRLQLLESGKLARLFKDHKFQWSPSDTRSEVVDLLSYVRAASKVLGNHPLIVQNIENVEALFDAHDSGEITQEHFERERQTHFECLLLSLIALKETQIEEETPNPNES